MFKSLKRKKRLLALLVVIAMVLVPLAAYGSQYDNYEPSEEVYEGAGYPAPAYGYTDGYANISGTSGEYQSFAPFYTRSVSSQTQLLQALLDNTVTGIHINSPNPISIDVAGIAAEGLSNPLEINVPVTAMNGGFIVESGVILILNSSLTGDPGTGTGVLVLGGGTLTMNSGAVVSGFNGRGVEVRGNNATFNLSGGEVSGNTNLPGGPNAGWGGGGVLVNGAGGTAIFNMTDGIISGNRNYQANGGGVSVVNGGIFNMTDGYIYNNTAYGDRSGGGVSVLGNAVLHLHGGFIRNNNASRGGGVNIQGGIFYMHSGTIDLNTARYGGGGVHTSGDAVFTMHNGMITNNRAYYSYGRPQGGGVFAGGALFDMRGGMISNNTAHEGGGVFHLRNDFNMREGAIITGNTATTLDPTGNSGGGGVMIGIDPTIRTFTMYGGLITNNNALNSSGGGVNIYGEGGIFDMRGGSIIDNRAGAYGGAISARVSSAVINISNGTISENRAIRNGGAIGLLEPSTSLTIGGETHIYNNTAANGGGIGFRLANDAPITQFVAFLSETNIANSVVFERNTALAGSRPNQDLHNAKTPALINPRYITQRYGTGAFTNNYIHTPFTDIRWLQVTKYWDGDRNYIDERPEYIRVELLSGEPPAPLDTPYIITITAANDWVGFFSGLSSDGAYAIRELNVPRPYFSDCDEAELEEPEIETSIVWTTSFTNTWRYIEEYGDPYLTTFRVTKEWYGDRNHLNHRPAYITVELRRRDQNAPVEIHQLRPNPAGQWIYEWEDLYVFNDAGAPIVYYVVERNVPARYRPRYGPVIGNAEDGFRQIITNIFTPPGQQPPPHGRDKIRGPLTGDMASVAPLLAVLMFASSAVLGGTSLKKKLKDRF